MEAAVKLTGLKQEVLQLALSNCRDELRNGLPQMQELAKLAAQLRVQRLRDVSADLAEFRQQQVSARPVSGPDPYGDWEKMLSMHSPLPLPQSGGERTNNPEGPGLPRSRPGCGGRVGPDRPRSIRDLWWQQLQREYFPSRVLPSPLAVASALEWGFGSEENDPIRAPNSMRSSRVVGGSWWATASRLPSVSLLVFPRAFFRRLPSW